MTVSLDGEPKVPWEEKPSLVNQPEKKIYEYLSRKKMKKDQINLEDYEELL